MRGSCVTDVCYGLVARGRVWRLTFSESLALFIQRRNPTSEVWRLDLATVGPADETSTNCVFGIQRVSSGRLLRVATTYEEASFLCQDPSRRPVMCQTRKAERYRSALVPHDSTFGKAVEATA
jgi:hypothetical protein